MMTEKGTLPIGIEIDGVVHKDFEIRPRIVKDSVEVSAEQDAVKLENNTYYGVCLLAKQVIRIGEISTITSDIVMGMYGEDCSELREADQRLVARLKSFRGEGSGEPKDTAGTPETQDPV